LFKNILKREIKIGIPYAALKRGGVPMNKTVSVFLYFLFPFLLLPFPFPLSSQEEGEKGQEEKQEENGSTSGEIRFSGFVDGYYSYNFGKPPSGKNTLTNFDFYHNTFSLNLAEVVIEKEVDPIGFRMDLDFGPTADWVAGYNLYGEPATPSFETTFFKHIQQGFFVWHLTPELTLIGGKTVTHMGFEVIETKDNWNYTRSLGFAYAIPYYHTGFQLSYTPLETLKVSAWLTNGWNTTIDNNKIKTGHLQIGFTPAEVFSLTLNWLGPEESFDTYKRKHVVEGIVTGASGKIRWAGIVDRGWQKGIDEEGTFKDGQTYLVLGAYLRYQILEKTALALRYEYSRDPDNVLYGAGVDGGVRVQEGTVTMEQMYGSSLLLRLEYRRDFADQDIFEKKGVDGGVKTQDRVVLGTVVSF